MRRCSGKKHSGSFIRENSVGLRERRFWEWKFENDNGSNQKILIARQYVENWTDMKRKNCRTASDRTSWNREKFLCRLYCKCTFGTGRTCHDDEFFQDLKRNDQLSGR